MRIQVITQTRGRSGRAMQQKREVTGDWIRVGRAASSEIHLPDPRIALNQGLILNRDGLVYSEGESGNFSQTATALKSVRSLRFKPGTSIDIGPYKFTSVAPPPGFDGAVTIELMRPADAATAEFSTRSQKLTLASLRLPKRWASWLLFLVVAGVFFALPAGRVLELPWHAASQDVLMASDRFWNPGPVLLAHQPIEQKCSACHEVAFEHVKDTACLQCHQKIGHHVGPKLQPAALFSGERCTTCHRDHKGAKPTHRDDDTFCVDCHKDLQGKSKEAVAQNATDFARDHPPFRLSLPDAQGKAVRVRPGTQAITERSNLAFPHDLHLDPQGVKSPDQGRVKLDCGACHAPDASKRTFEPVAMKKHCQSCHKLEFEPAVTTREVPHGKAQEARVVVDEFYANLALNGVADSFQKAFGVPGEGLLRRAGSPSDTQRQSALSLAQAKAEKVATELFETRVCGTCHVVTRVETAGKPDWKVEPIRANHRWMPQARFDHRSHAQSKCTDCHAAAKSKVSSDVSMPTLEGCRQCHGGSKPAANLVTSNCLLCHGFHDAQHPWDPNFKPRLSPHVAGK